MERRFISARAHPVKLETRDGASQKIAGYASVFYQEGDPQTEYQLWDDFSERVMPGAFDRALAEGDDVRALFNHSPDNLLGRTVAGTLKLSVDATGLRYEITPPDTTIGKDVCASLARGDLSGSSFAFIPDEITWREVGKVLIREIRSVRLWDVGPVTYPAYGGATAGIRSAGDADEARKAAAEWRSTQGDWQAQEMGMRLRLVEVDGIIFQTTL